MFALEVLGEDGAGGLLQPLGSSPVFLGRAVQNDLVVSDPTVSGRHLSVWVADGYVFVEDLGSRNGTHVRGDRIAEVVKVVAGDEVRAGEGTRLRIVKLQRRSTPVGSGHGAAWAVEDIASGVQYPVRTDRFRIGGDPHDDLVVTGMAPRQATLMFHPNGETWLGVDDEEREVVAEQPFEFGGRAFVVRHATAPSSDTIGCEETRYPYAITADLSAAGGPWAEIEDVQAGTHHRFTGETRAVLLHLLAVKRIEDETAGVDDDEVGWCGDRDVMVGIWGKSGGDAPLSKLNTLVCRVRQELREAGFDPWFVEKRRGATRARVRTPAGPARGLAKG